MTHINSNHMHLNKYGIITPHPPICSILPSFELKESLERGNADEKESALQTIVVSEQIRGERRKMGVIAAEVIPSAGKKDRTIFNAQNGWRTPGILARKEGDIETGDIAVDEAYSFAGFTYDFYLQQFQRHSIDDKELPLISVVHFGKNFSNALWNGRIMIYGDGDGKYMGRTTAHLDVVSSRTYAWYNSV